MNQQEFDELAAGHALHALSDADEQRYHSALRDHPGWAPIGDDDAATAAALGSVVPVETPPAAIRADLLALIAKTPQHDEIVAAADASPAAASSIESSHVEPQHAARPRNRYRALFALAACLVLLVGIGAGAMLFSQLQRPASVIALEQIENAPDAQEGTIELESGGTATAHWAESIGSVVLVTDGLEPLGDDQAYELWFVRGDAPVSAGVFDADAETTTALLDGEMQPGDAIAVTVEQAGGSPSGAPTTDPIIVIPTA